MVLTKWRPKQDGRPFESRTQKLSERWPFESRTVRLTVGYCIHFYSICFSEDSPWPKLSVSYLYRFSMTLWDDFLSGRFDEYPSEGSISASINESYEDSDVTEATRRGWTGGGGRSIGEGRLCCGSGLGCCWCCCTGAVVVR
jgi:hypothetical protein